MNQGPGGLDPIALAHLGGADAGHLAGPDRLQDRGEGGGELVGVPVAAGHDHRPAAPLLAGHGGGQKVIRLEPRRLGVREATGLNQGRQYRKLLHKFGVDDAPGLIARKQPLAVIWRVERVPGDETARGASPSCRRSMKVGEADDGARTLVASPPDGFRHGVICPVGKRVAVDHKQRLGHS
jgi:hypothetical protein